MQAKEIEELEEDYYGRYGHKVELQKANASEEELSKLDDEFEKKLFEINNRYGESVDTMAYNFPDKQIPEITEERKLSEKQLDVLIKNEAEEMCDLESGFLQ